MVVEAREGREVHVSAPTPEDPNATRCIPLLGIFIEASHHGWMEPGEARSLAQGLIAAADAVEKAHLPYSNPEPETSLEEPVTPPKKGK